MATMNHDDVIVTVDKHDDDLWTAEAVHLPTGKMAAGSGDSEVAAHHVALQLLHRLVDQPDAG